MKIKGLEDITNQKSNKNDEHAAGRKRKKKRKKTHASSQDEKKDSDKCANSSEDVTDYSDEDDPVPNNSTHSHQLSSQTHTNLLQSTHHHSSPVLNEQIEIEPSRLLEQTMITGDVCIGYFEHF